MNVILSQRLTERNHQFMNVILSHSRLGLQSLAKAMPLRPKSFLSSPLLIYFALVWVRTYMHAAQWT